MAVTKKTKSPGSAKTAAGKKIKKSPEAKKEKKLKKEKKQKVKEKGKAKAKAAVGGGKAKKSALDSNQKKLLKLAGQGQEDEGDLSGREDEYDPVDELRRRARRSPSYVSRYAR